MANNDALVRWGMLGAIGVLQIACQPSLAQAGAPIKERQRVAIARSRPLPHRLEASDQAATPRTLTILRPPRGPIEDWTDTDIYLDGGVRYNSVRTYDPAPYADSGKQFPLGLDGIGGYGSYIGFGAGQDSALYDRGP